MKETRLRALLGELRRLLRDEVPLRLTRSSAIPRTEPIQVSRYDPKARRWQPNWDEQIQVQDAGSGQPFTAAFTRYLGHADDWGQTRPGTASILEISEWCHGRHTSHEIPGNSRSLCAQLVYEASYLGKGLSEISAIYSLPSTQAAGMLTSALTHAAQWRERAEPLQTDYDAPDPLLRTA